MKIGSKHSAETRKKMSNSQKGKIPWNKGKKMTKEYCESISKGRTGCRVSEKGKKKIKESRKWMIGSGNPAKRPEIRKKISKSYKQRKINGESLGFQHGNNNIAKRSEVRKKISDKAKERWEQHPERRKEFSERMKNENPMHDKNVREKYNKIMKSDEYFEKYKKGIRRKPNKLEIKFNNFLNDNFQNEWKFVGDFSFWIGRKNPDFIHLQQLKVIELYGNYWHTQDEVPERINYFSKYNYKTLIIWESDFKKDEKKIIEQIKEFIKNE